MSLQSCKTAKCPNTTGTLKDLTGLDGCGWVIELEDQSKLEPTNLNDFNIALEEGKTVHFKYSENKEMGSICMVGKSVTLECIE